MAELISECIVPCGGTADGAAMGRGEPGLPAGFHWREGVYKVTEVLERWKHSSREGGKAAGELYLRRHYFRLRMDNGAIWTIYFVRQSPKSGSAKARWFLYTLDEQPGDPG